MGRFSSVTLLLEIGLIVENDFELNFNLYKEYVYVPEKFEKTESLLKKIKVLEKSISEQLSQLDKF